MAHVPYRSSGPALTDLFAGHVQVMFDAITSTIEHIKADRLCPLAVTSPPRSALIPDTPLMSDFVPGYDVSNWFGLGMPSHTPQEIIDRLNGAVNEGLTDRQIEGALRRPRRNHAARLARAFRPAHRRRDREMGQGHPDGQYQAGVGPCDPMLSAVEEIDDAPTRAPAVGEHPQARRASMRIAIIAVPRFAPDDLQWIDRIRSRYDP